MPLIEIKNTGKQGKIGLWHIAESAEELLGLRTFSKEDLDRVDSIPHSSRKKEWLVSRIVLNQLTGLSNASIFYDEYTKPFLKEPKNSFISISHSRELHAMILDARPTGIDVELIQPKIVSLKHKFLSDAELTSLSTENFTEQLTLCWSIKETLYKYFGKKELAFKEHLHIHPFAYSASGGKVQASICKNDLNEVHTLAYETIYLGEQQYLLVYRVHEV